MIIYVGRNMVKKMVEAYERNL
ncbi:MULTISPECIES: small, acid-soluble spore protein, alpha/beta type [Clostridium]